jgi:hypothetical protein
MKTEQKLAIVRQLYQDKHVITVTKNYGSGKVKPITKTGLISKFPRDFSGCWGVEGDRIAVYVNNEPFAAEDVIKACGLWVTNDA